MWIVLYGGLKLEIVLDFMPCLIACKVHKVRIIYAGYPWRKSETQMSR